MKKITVKLFFLSLLFTIHISAQTKDSVVNESGIVMDTIKDQTVYVPTKDPKTAVWKSAILPGWGQYYNESYWKIPVVWGVIGWCVYNYATNNNNYLDYSELYIQSNYSIESYRRLRDFYRDQRDLFVIYIGITYLANLLDAYVDANLFDFDVSENFYTGSKMLNIKFKF